jgi:hypothetical protein
MSTQTDVLAMLVVPHVPPWVRVAVPICIPPEAMVSVIVTESAKAAGTASIAATKTASIETLKLLRTDKPPFLATERRLIAAANRPSKLWKSIKIKAVPTEALTALALWCNLCKTIVGNENFCTLCENDCIKVRPYCGRRDAFGMLVYVVPQIRLAPNREVGAFFFFSRHAQKRRRRPTR